MGRWRPPSTPGSPYITPEGARAVRAEHRHLWKELRPEVVKALSEAAAEGDRSENAEYIYRKKQLGEIDRRVRYLSKQLDRIQVVDQRPLDESRVFFGSWVTLDDGSGESRCHRIVGADETDAAKGWISIDPPVATALIGKTVGDEVQVDLPEGQVSFLLEGVSYDPP